VRFGPISGRTVPMSGRVWRVAGALVLVTAVAGVIGVGPARPAGAYVERVELANMRFNPPRVQIQLGDTVIWEAADDDHTVTARDGTFDSSSRGLMAEGDQFRWRFRVPGTYAYFCRVHQNRGMQGEVVVVEPSAPTTTRLTPVTAAATTSTTAAATTATPATLPVTTTSRPLATSSTTSLRQATNTTVLPGDPAVPQEPPALNPNAPVLTGAGTSVLPETQAAARRAEAENDPLPVLALVAVAALTLFGGVVGVRTHRRRSSA
jgi:plastocyanin